MDKKIKYTLIAFGLSIIFIIIMGIPTALIPNPFVTYSRMTPITNLDYFFLFTTSALLAILISLKLYFKSKKQIGVKELIGGTLGFVAFSCPLCSILLVTLLGSVIISSFIEPLRPLLGIISIIILSYLIYKTLQCKDCNVKGEQLCMDIKKNSEEV